MNYGLSDIFRFDKTLLTIHRPARGISPISVTQLQRSFSQKFHACSTSKNSLVFYERLPKNCLLMQNERKTGKVSNAFGARSYLFVNKPVGYRYELLDRTTFRGIRRYYVMKSIPNKKIKIYEMPERSGEHERLDTVGEDTFSGRRFFVPVKCLRLHSTGIDIKQSTLWFESIEFVAFVFSFLPQRRRS